MKLQKSKAGKDIKKPPIPSSAPEQGHPYF